MIKITRLKGDVFYVNPDLIETLEETPDTVITLNNGNKYVVREKVETIIEEIKDFKKDINLRIIGKEV